MSSVGYRRAGMGTTMRLMLQTTIMGKLALVILLVFSLVLSSCSDSSKKRTRRANRAEKAHATSTAATDKVAAEAHPATAREVQKKPSECVEKGYTKVADEARLGLNEQDGKRLNENASRVVTNSEG